MHGWAKITISFGAHRATLLFVSNKSERKPAVKPKEKGKEGTPPSPCLALLIKLYD
jgi:hypothetical protein